METTFLGIIPSRFASTRFPGKPLVLIGGKTMIRRVYERAAQSLPDLYVATDDERIFREVESFGGKAIMTSPHHRSGTDRCAEALALLREQTGRNWDVVVNVQGDEPFIQPGQLERLKACFVEPDCQIATLVKAISSVEDLLNPDLPKVVLNQQSEAIYFSRSPIPFLRGSAVETWPSRFTYYRHIGLYAYRAAILPVLTQLAPTPLEEAESLEQLRWIGHRIPVRTAITTEETIGIDSPADLDRIPPELLQN